MSTRKILPKTKNIPIKKKIIKDRTLYTEDGKVVMILHINGVYRNEALLYMKKLGITWEDDLSLFWKFING